MHQKLISNFCYAISSAIFTGSLFGPTKENLTETTIIMIHDNDTQLNYCHTQLGKIQSAKWTITGIGNLRLFGPYLAALSDYQKMKGNLLLSVKLLKFDCCCSECLIKFVIYSFCSVAQSKRLTEL